MLKGLGEDDMAIWPFGRKKKKFDTSTTGDPSMGVARSSPAEGTRRDSAAEPSLFDSPSLGKRSNRNDGERRHRSSSRKLTKSQRFRAKDVGMAEPVPSVPADPEFIRTQPDHVNEKPLGHQFSMPPENRGNVPSYYFQDPRSMSSLQPDKFTATPSVPTLRAKRSANNDSSLPRRKSSKRKADDHAREQEIKAMSSPIPVPRRPPSHSVGVLSRDGQKSPSGPRRDFERPLSDISLRLPESVHSTMSVASDSHSFRVSTFDVLSPRPTIRYCGHPRSKDAGFGSYGGSRTSTKKERAPIIPEEALKSKKRINELADDLDAPTLRELMERDQRRSERSRTSDQEKLQRRLQRRAEKQRAMDDGHTEPHDGPLKENVDPKEGSHGDLNLGLGIARATATPVLEGSSLLQSREQGSRTPESWLNDPSKDHLLLPAPIQDPADEQFTSHLGMPSPTVEQEEPVLETAKAVRLSQASMSPPMSPLQNFYGPSSLSQVSDLASRSTPDIPDRNDTRRDSDNSGRLSSNWTSIFRRSGTRAKRSSTDRGRTVPTEFLNTSRESLSRQMPPSVFARVPAARSGTPVRTQSRFREDLPELPISPPASRVHSPGASLPPRSLTDDQKNPELSNVVDQLASSDRPLSEIHPAFREQIALSRQQSVKSTSVDIPSSAVLSQSLASVDSEGSWLTGRPVKRSSQTLINPLRESASSLHQRSGELGASEGPLNIARMAQIDIGRLTPGPEDDPSPHIPHRPPFRMNHSGVGASSDSDEDESLIRPQPPRIAPDEGKWHGAIGKQPTIVRQEARTRSREGLLNDFQAGEDSVDSSLSVDSPVGLPFEEMISSPENPFIHRATSVDLGKGHARHISAGSARLLDLPRRSSTEMKRVSTASGERSPLSISLRQEPEETRASDVD